MPEYLHPGVYVEETSFRAKPIEGVSTSTAGLVGRTRKGPEGRPTLVTSFTQFVREFGAPFSAPVGVGDYLGHAVRAFFENGGRRAYIVRALAADAAAATSDDPVDPNRLGIGAVLRLPPTATVIGPTAILPLDSLRNIRIGVNLEIQGRSTATTGPTPLHTVTVTDYDATRNTVTVTPAFPVNTVLNPAATFVHVDGIAPEGGTHVDGPVARARSRGAGGNDIAVEIRPRDFPPARLATRRIARNRPIIAAFDGVTHVGPAAATSTMNLSGVEARHLRPGDRFVFPTGDTRTVLTIANGTVGFAAAVGAANHGPGASVRVVTRAGITPPAPVEVYRLTAGESFDLTAASPVTVPHGVVASLHVGDVIEVDSAAGTTTCTIGAVTFAAAVAVTFSPATTATENFSAGTVRLTETVSAPLSVTTRLIAGDLTGLTPPFGVAPFQPIGISAGAAADASTLRLVDTLTSQVYVERTEPPAPGSGDFPDAITNASWTTLELLRVVAAGDPTFAVAATSGFYIGAIVEIDTGTIKHSRVISGIDPANRLLTVSTPIGTAVEVTPDVADRRAFIRVLEIDVLIYERDAGGALLLKESFTNLTWNHDATAASYARYYVEKLNDPELGSKLITLAAPSPLPVVSSETQPTTDEGFPQFLINGTDGSPLGAIDVIGSDNGPHQRFGIQALAERKDIALVAVPGVTDEIVQQQLINHCELLRYRFAVLDGRPAQPVVTDILSHRNNYDTKYAGYYAPWLTTVDLTTGRTLDVPPSGYVLGICARVDNERGVHKAPANETVRGIIDVELPFTDGEQDVLNPVGVNLIREFEGRGIRVWGARTLSSDPEWKYVNVRRLFIYLEHSIDNGTQWVVFEPNNEALWARVKSTIESFLYGVWKTGAFMGTKPEDAYFVRCDRSTMTQDDIDNGRLVCLIGVAPTYPAEFVIFRIGQFTASSNLA